MRPVTVSIDLDHGIDEVFAFLDVMANHELFTDHFMRQWRCSGPPAGIGARARVVNVLAGGPDPVEIVVVDSNPPHWTTERNVSAGGRRIAEGTYALSRVDDGRTRVTFTYKWLEVPRADRLLAPVARRLLRRAVMTALERLRAALAEGTSATTQGVSVSAAR